jgi:hypothetical protein
MPLTTSTNAPLGRKIATSVENPLKLSWKLFLAPVGSDVKSAIVFHETREGVGLATTSTYGYDYTDQRVKADVDGTTTYYPTKYYNITGTSVTKHIFAKGYPFPY